jgi:large subunit ribosomal protein L24
VLAVHKETNRVIVEGVNLVTKHTREGQSDRGAKTGGIVTQEAPIHISNVSLVDPKSKKPTKAGFKIEVTKDGKKKTRISRKSGEAI